MRFHPSPNVGVGDLGDGEAIHGRSDERMPQNEPVDLDFFEGIDHALLAAAASVDEEAQRNQEQRGWCARGGTRSRGTGLAFVSVVVLEDDHGRAAVAGAVVWIGGSGPVVGSVVWGPCTVIGGFWNADAVDAHLCARAGVVLREDRKAANLRAVGRNVKRECLSNPGRRQVQQG